MLIIFVISYHVLSDDRCQVSLINTSIIEDTELFELGCMKFGKTLSYILTLSNTTVLNYCSSSAIYAFVLWVRFNGVSFLEDKVKLIETLHRLHLPI